MSKYSIQNDPYIQQWIENSRIEYLMKSEVKNKDMTNIISPIEIVLKRDVAGKIPKGTKGRIVSIEVLKYSVHVEFENGMSYSDTYYGMTKEEMIETFEYKK